MDKQALGEAIRAARKKAGMTQAALGAAMGVSTPTVCGWEKGRIKPCASRYERLYEVLPALDDRVPVEEIPKPRVQLKNCSDGENAEG